MENKTITQLLIEKYSIVYNLEEGGTFPPAFWENERKLLEALGKELNNYNYKGDK